MDQAEKEYIDKKFEEMHDKLINPDPELVRQRTQTVNKQIILTSIVALVVTVIAMIASFLFFGIIHF